MIEKLKEERDQAQAQVTELLVRKEKFSDLLDKKARLQQALEDCKSENEKARLAIQQEELEEKDAYAHILELKAAELALMSQKAQLEQEQRSSVKTLKDLSEAHFRRQAYLYAYIAQLGKIYPIVPPESYLGAFTLICFTSGIAL